MPESNHSLTTCEGRRSGSRLKTIHSPAEWALYQGPGLLPARASRRLVQASTYECLVLKINSF